MAYRSQIASGVILIGSFQEIPFFPDQLVRRVVEITGLLISFQLPGPVAEGVIFILTDTDAILPDFCQTIQIIILIPVHPIVSVHLFFDVCRNAVGNQRGDSSLPADCRPVS